MLDFLSKSVDKPSRARRAAAPPGKRAYAIGDVHGRLDLLEDILQQIERDIGERPTKSNHIIFLGDLIDRGPSSRGVIERLIDYHPDNIKCHFIMGNHEEVLVRGLRGEPIAFAPCCCSQVLRFASWRSLRGERGVNPP